MNIKQKGNIVIPVLFVVVVFAILLTSGRMFNSSVVNLTERFNNPISSNESSHKNLQVKDLQFTQVVPPPTGNTCDGSQQGYNKVIKKADLGTQACCYFHAYTDDCSVCCSEICVDKNSNQRKMVNPGIEPPEDADFWCDAKPIIYLYPQVPTIVNVEVIVPGEFLVSIPQIESGLVSPEQSIGGWKSILAMPSGNFYYQKGFYKELFYEATVTPIEPPNHGIIVQTKDLKFELKKVVEKLGLKGQETNDFLEFWVPKLESLDSKYMLISFFDSAQKQQIDKVIISPKPDTFIEFIMYFKPLNELVKIDSIKYPNAPERLGFTAVEWGGVIDRD